MGKSKSDNKTIKILTRAAIIVCIIVIALYVAVTLERVNITASTIKRVPVPAGSVNKTDYFTEDYRIEDASVLEKGLKHFYNKTGVQPYIHIISSINFFESLRGRDLMAYARTLYPQLFTDESHMLFLVYDNDTSDYYEYYIVSGSNAKTVMDSQAEEILIDCIRWYSYEPDLSLDEIFSVAFSDAGDRIMTTTPPSWLPVPIVSGVLIILVLLFVWLRSNNIKKKLRAQQNAEILNMPLEQYGADTGAKVEIPVQNYNNASESFMEVNNAANITMAQEAHIKRQIDMNAAETAKYEDLARQALRAGKEDDARIFISMKQNLETARAVLDTAYANVLSMRRMGNDMMNSIQDVQTHHTVNVQTTVMKNGKIINQTSYTNTPQSAADAFSHLDGEADKLFAKANAMLSALDNMPANPAMVFHSQAAQGNTASADVVLKDEAEALAEKYAAQGRMAFAEKRKNARTKASVDDELEQMKKDMGL